MRWMIQGLIPGRGKIFSASKACLDWLWGPPSLLFSGYRSFFLQKLNGQSVNLLSCTLLVPRSRIGGATPLFHPYAFMACTGTAVPLSVPLPALTPKIGMTQELYITFCMLYCYRNCLALCFKLISLSFFGSELDCTGVASFMQNAW